VKALVTGATGFIGRHLVAHLTRGGWEVTTVRWSNGADQLHQDVQQAAPDVVFHLAGLTRAAEAPAFYEANTVLPARLLDVIAHLRQAPVVVLAGSAAEYGRVPTGAVPVSESQACHPVTDYGISKYAQTLMGLARAASGMPVVVARIWNAVGPAMPAHLALASFATQIAAMPATGGTLQVGNLDVERDFIDVRELVRLLAELSQRPGAIGQVINLCSGRYWRLRGLVDHMIALTGRPIDVAVDPARLRPDETPVLYGDTAALRRLGLAPEPPDFDRILPEMLAKAEALRSPPRSA
jgi:GDP-4-dehydro-6-deoxy-D-mannose reductase